MAMQHKKYGELYTHKEDGGIYYYNGLAHGTGDQRGELLHIYTDYFTDVTFYRDYTWTARMERISVPGLRLSRFINPNLWVNTIIGLFVIILTRVVVFNNTFSDITAMDIIAMLGIVILSMGIPSMVLHLLYRWKYKKTY